MKTNFLEELLAEWYEYQGYFLKRNILVGKRKKGGYECELDIVAFHPNTNHLVHIECSMDSDSWSTRENRFSKKVNACKKHIRNMFKGFELPDKIDHIAVLGFASKQNHQVIGGAKIILIPEVLNNILHSIRLTKISTSAVSEHLIILRTLQFVNEYQEVLFK